MREFCEKRKFRKVLFSPVAFILLLALLVFLVIGTTKIYLKSKTAEIKNEEVQKEMMGLERKKTDLEKEIARLQTGSGMEEELRKKFNVTKPGEEILVIVDKFEEAENDSSQGDKDGFFQGIWQWVKGLF